MKNQLSERLERLNSCFLRFGSDPDKNINILVRLGGEVLSADGSSYSRLEGTDLFNLGKWNLPDDYPERYKAKGVVCDDVIKMRSRNPLVIKNLLKSKYAKSETVIEKYKIKTYIGTPVRWNNQSVGALCVFFKDEREPGDEDLYFLNIIATAIAVEEDRKRSLESLNNTLTELEEIKDQLKEENSYLKEEIKLNQNFEEMIGDSKELKKVLKKIKQVASSDANVLILGESGTGKELIASAVHNHSNRKDRTFVKVNCGAIASGLVESELFGHEKGAFSGALQSRVGRFEFANEGTIFLDEVCEMSIETQVKFLRVLQEGEFERLGSSAPVKVNVRVIAATNKDLEKLVREGKFREDLYYRLNVFPITVPPLRDRIEDIKPLTNHFTKKYSEKIGKQIEKIDIQAVDALHSYSWPGNIRELQNIIERAVILAEGGTIHLRDLPDLSVSRIPTTENADTNSLVEIERAHIIKVLEESNWVIEGNNGASKLLNMNPSTLRSRMKKLGIKRNQSFS